MSQSLDGPPYKSDVTEKPGLLSGDWTRWLQLFWARVASSIQQVGTPKSLTGQSASIATTTAFTVTQTALYRFSWYMRITTVDAVNSSAQLAVTWREGGVTLTKTFTALTGNTTTTYDGAVWPFVADSGTLIAYAVTYASNTPAQMRYRLALVVEQIS